MTNNKQESSFLRTEGASNTKYSLRDQPSKRFSFIDKGKSWAKQLIKNNKLPNSPSLTAHKSFDSCDSGIDVNSYSSNSSKISASSSCSFITNLQSDLSSTYLSNSNSSCLISPIDESGYLVPIINYSLLNKNKNIPSRKVSNSHLIRSFSTRSAYSSSNCNNLILNNRATICEQIRTSKDDNEFCIKCNSKLKLGKDRRSIFSINQPIEEELVKSNESYSFFESFTCENCLKSASEDKLKVPKIRAPSPPLQKHLSEAPPLPTQPPPSLNKITPILIQNNVSNQVRQTDCNCVKNSINSSDNPKFRSSTPEFETYLANTSLNLSHIIKTEPIIYIDSQEEVEYTMNSLFNKLKLKKCEPETTRLQHDYHHIDDELCDKKYLTRSDRVESFEFINLQNKQQHQQETPIIKYEPSWEESTIFLVNNLKTSFDKPSFISSRNFNCSFRENKSKSYPLRNLNQNPQRASFPLQLKTSQSFNKQLNSDDIERLLSGSISDSDSKTMTDSSENSICLSDSLVDIESSTEPWYQPEMPRENVLNYLIGQEIGSFVIRLSTSCKNCFALSIRVPYFANQNGVAHYLITKDRNGFKLKGVEKEFKTLKSLVTHYSVMQEILPVTLNMTNSRYELSNFQFLNCNQIKKPNFLSRHNIKNASCLIK